MKHIRWRVQINLSGTLGEQAHGTLATEHDMSVTCIDGKDQLTSWSGAWTSNDALSVVIGQLPMEFDTMKVERVEIEDAQVWEERQRRKLSPLEAEMLRIATGL